MRTLLIAAAFAAISSAASAATLDVFASGSFSGVDEDGLFGAAGAVYDNAQFTVAGSIDTDAITGTTSTSGSETSVAAAGFGLATATLDGTPLAFGSGNGELFFGFNASISLLDLFFRDSATTFLKLSAIRADTSLTSIASIPAGNLCGGSCQAQVVVNDTDQLIVGLDTLTIGAAVPEPATWVVMILGFGLAGSMLRRVRSVPTRA